MVTSKLSHEDLRKLATRWLKTRTVSCEEGGLPRGGRCSIACSELVSSADDTPDAIGWDPVGRSILIECKSNRADFHQDGNKRRSAVGLGMGNQRYYMAPFGVIPKDQIPKDWGLLEVEETGRIWCTVRASIREIDAHEQCNEKLMLLSLIRRINKREFLIIQSEEMDNLLQSGVLCGEDS